MRRYVRPELNLEEPGRFITEQALARAVADLGGGSVMASRLAGAPPSLRGTEPIHQGHISHGLAPDNNRLVTVDS